MERLERTRDFLARYYGQSGKQAEWIDRYLKEYIGKYYEISETAEKIYNIYKLRMLVRHDENGKLYLYDFLRTKKETSSPLE